MAPNDVYAARARILRRLAGGRGAGRPLATPLVGAVATFHRFAAEDLRSRRAPRARDGATAFWCRAPPVSASPPLSLHSARESYDLIRIIMIRIVVVVLDGVVLLLFQKPETCRLKIGLRNCT